MAAILILDDDALGVSVLRRTLLGFERIFVAETCASARETMANEVLDAAVVEVSLVDGCGLDVARELRRARPTAPILVLTAKPIDDRREELFDLRAEQLYKGRCGPQRLEEFRDRALEATKPERAIARAFRLSPLAERLSPVESTIVHLAAAGARRAELSAIRGVSENTTKVEVSRVLAKTGATSFDDLGRRAVQRITPFDARAWEASMARLCELARKRRR